MRFFIQVKEGLRLSIMFASDLLLAWALKSLKRNQLFVSGRPRGNAQQVKPSSRPSTPDVQPTGAKQ